MIVGSSETTATTLSGTIYLLATNRPVLAKLYREIRDAFQSGDEIDFISVQKLEYMFVVLHEGLRIYLAVPAAIPRKTSEGAMIGSHYVPANVSLQLTILYRYCPFAHKRDLDNHRYLAVAHVPQPQILQGPRVLCSRKMAW